MEITLAMLVSAVLLGFAFPQYVRSRPHLLLGSGCVAIAMLMIALTRLVIVGWLSGLLGDVAQAGAFVLLTCALSGLSFSQWRAEVRASTANV
jgi:hypothetical protein